MQAYYVTSKVYRSLSTTVSVWRGQIERVVNIFNIKFAIPCPMSKVLMCQDNRKVIYRDVDNCQFRKPGQNPACFSKKSALRKPSDAQQMVFSSCYPIVQSKNVLSSTNHGEAGVIQKRQVCPCNRILGFRRICQGIWC